MKPILKDSAEPATPESIPARSGQRKRPKVHLLDTSDKLTNWVNVTVNCGTVLAIAGPVMMWDRELLGPEPGAGFCRHCWENGGYGSGRPVKRYVYALAEAELLKQEGE